MTIIHSIQDSLWNLHLENTEMFRIAQQPAADGGHQAAQMYIFKFLESHAACDRLACSLGCFCFWFVQLYKI